jgi:hypothetical protein
VLDVREPAELRRWPVSRQTGLSLRRNVHGHGSRRVCRSLTPSKADCRFVPSRGSQHAGGSLLSGARIHPCGQYCRWNQMLGRPNWTLRFHAIEMPGHATPCMPCFPDFTNYFECHHDSVPPFLPSPCSCPSALALSLPAGAQSLIELHAAARAYDAAYQSAKFKSGGSALPRAPRHAPPLYPPAGLVLDSLAHQYWLPNTCGRCAQVREHLWHQLRHRQRQAAAVQPGQRNRGHEQGSKGSKWRKRNCWQVPSKT